MFLLSLRRDIEIFLYILPTVMDFNEEMRNSHFVWIIFEWKLIAPNWHQVDKISKQHWDDLSIDFSLDFTCRHIQSCPIFDMVFSISLSPPSICEIGMARSNWIWRGALVKIEFQKCMCVRIVQLHFPNWQREREKRWYLLRSPWVWCENVCDFDTIS